MVSKNRIKRKVAVMTTVYPDVEMYLPKFFESIELQSFMCFDLVIVNDGMRSLSNHIDRLSEVSVVELDYSGSPAKNREYGINYCIDNGYEILIFADSDDYFQHNRVQVSINKLKKSDVVVNDLTTFSDDCVIEDKYISNRLCDGDLINESFIQDKNIFGFTNTAISLKGMEKIKIPSNVVAADWYFFRSLIRNKKAVFTNQTVSFYRQYSGNITGLMVVNGVYKLWWEK